MENGFENVFAGLGKDTDKEAALQLRQEAADLRLRAETENDPIKKAELLDEARENEVKANELWPDEQAA